MPTDVAIVGGGPIGLATARAAAEHGARTTVFERNSEASSPSCCTGLVSPRTLPTLGVSDDSVLREIHALRVHLPSGRQIDLRSESVKAVVIDRAVLEAELLLRAAEAGADIQFSAEVIGAEPGKLSVRSGSKIRSTTASVIVGADGPRSKVATWLSLEQPRSFVSATQVELEAIPTCADQVQVFVGNDVAPGFIGWSVPAQDGIIRVGLGAVAPHAPASLLNRLLAEHYPHARILTRSAGWIPLAPVAQPATRDALLVGDAAGHVKPLSGGGLYTGGLCARIAGETAAHSSGAESSTPELITIYPKRCLEAIGKELAFGRSIRQHLSQLTDEDAEAAATALDDSQFLQSLADYADIDHFHRLPDQLASDPYLWATILRIVPLLGSLIN